MVTTITKLATSPVAADNPLATSRMMTSGLRKRARNCSQSGERLTVTAVLGPYRRHPRLHLRGSKARTARREPCEEPVYRLRPDFFRPNFACCRHGAIAMWPARFAAFTRNVH